MPGPLLAVSLLAAASAAPPAPAELEASFSAWLPELSQQLKQCAPETIEATFAEVFLTAGRPPSAELNAQLCKNYRGLLRGTPRIACRGTVCRASYGKPRNQTQLTFALGEDGWTAWLPTYAGSDAIPGQVSLSVSLDGPGVLQFRLNGSPTFLLDEMTAGSQGGTLLNRALTTGENTLELVPDQLPTGSTQQITVRIGLTPPGDPVDTARDDLLHWSGEIAADQALPFEVPAAHPE